MVVKAIFKKADYSSKTGIRYDADFVMECLLSRIQCKAAYNHLRDQTILPLPSLSTKRRLLSCMPCTFGLNSFALSAIRRPLPDKPKEEKMDSLVLDEMSIAQSVEINSQELKFNGFVDFGDLVTVEECNGLADHALVLMFRPYRSNRVKPIGLFASKAAAPGEILHEMVLKAITTHTEEKVLTLDSAFDVTDERSVLYQINSSIKVDNKRETDNSMCKNYMEIINKSINLIYILEICYRPWERQNWTAHQSLYFILFHNHIEGPSPDY